MTKTLSPLLLICLAACGDSLAEPSDPAGRDAGDDSQDASEPIVCEDDQVRAAGGYEGERVWDRERLAACNAACPELGEECVQANCEGSGQFESCVKSELSACLTAESGPCRAEWTGLICCAREFCDELVDGALTDCLAANCAQVSSAFTVCRDRELDGTPAGPCLSSAQAACLLSDDAGADGGASGGDAGAHDGGAVGGDAEVASDAGMNDAGVADAGS
jgi:hypothetical protein